MKQKKLEEIRSGSPRKCELDPEVVAVFYVKPLLYLGGCSYIVPAEA